MVRRGKDLSQVTVTVNPTSPWFTRSCMKSHEWTFAKVGTTVHDNIFRSFDRGIVILSVFMAPDHGVLPASRNKSHRKLLTCFLGVGGPWPVISRTRAWKWRNSSLWFRRQCFIYPWIQPALFLIIAIATKSATVIWQFAGQGRILMIPLRLIISISRLRISHHC